MKGVSAYQEQVYRARLNALTRTLDAQQRMSDALRRAYTDLDDLLALREGVRMDEAMLWRSKLSVIRELLLDVAQTLQDTVRAGVTETADDMAAIRAAATERLMGVNGARFAGSFAEVPAGVVDLYTRRLDREGLKLSPAIWAEAQIPEIEERITAALARGQASIRLSSEVSQSLEENLRRFVLGTGPGEPPKGGSIRYKATRLARTEINNAYWEANVLTAHASPVVEAQVWQLSARHRIWDTCDLFAHQEAYDLGAGVYPTGKVPAKPHPQCLCYLEDVLRPVDEWAEPKRTPQHARIRIAAEALPMRLRQRIGEPFFTPGDLQSLVVNLDPKQRGHLTSRYVARQGDLLTGLTRMADLTPALGMAAQ